MRERHNSRYDILLSGKGYGSVVKKPAPGKRISHVCVFSSLVQRINWKTVCGIENIFEIFDFIECSGISISSTSKS